MTEEIEDHWSQRDVVVLRSAVKQIDRQQTTVKLEALAADTGLDYEVVEQSVRALARDGLIELDAVGRWGDEPLVRGVRDISGDAYRKVGAWPSPEEATTRLVDALNRVAADLEDDEEKSAFRKVADVMMESGRQVGVGVATAVITGQM